METGMTTARADAESSKHLLRNIRLQCKDVRVTSGIEVDHDAMDHFLLKVLPENASRSDWTSWLASGYKLPLSYPSLHAEINVLANLCLLNSLSGYRLAFHNALGQGAHKTIVQIVMSLYISDPCGHNEMPLSAETLTHLNPMLLLERLGLPTHVEEQHEELPGMTIGKRRRDDIFEALDTLCRAANETGRRLEEMNCPDLGTFIEQLLQQSLGKGNDDERASLFVSKLIVALPAFDDAHQLPSGLQVPIYKRALLLLSWLHSSFSQRSQLPLPDPSVLPAFIDNVIPSLLVHFSILDLSQAKDRSLQNWALQKHQILGTKLQDGPTLSREEAYIIRAAALDACHELSLRAHELGSSSRPWLANLNEALIDGFLWTQAKREDLKVVPRMVETKTYMY